MHGAASGFARRHGRRIGAAALAALIVAVAGAAAVEARRKATPEPAARFVAPAALFGLAGTDHPPAANFAKWTELLARYAAERKLERELCRRGDCALVKWRKFLAAIKRSDAMTQLGAVNAYINRVRYRTDQELYGSEDHWATPREFFARGGDCEDYAIAKYLSLRALGWPAERLRIVVVQDRARDLVHAALIAYHAGGAYLLDIEIGAVTEQADVDRYVPIFAISEAGWWSYRPGERAVTRAEAERRAKIGRVRHSLKAETRPLQSPKPPLRPAQSEPEEGDEGEDEEKDNAPVLEPGERIQEVFLPAAR